MPDVAKRLSPPTRFRVLEAMAEECPLPQDCPDCDPAGGCANPHRCRLDICERMLDVVEWETGHV